MRERSCRALSPANLVTSPLLTRAVVRKELESESESESEGRVQQAFPEGILRTGKPRTKSAHHSKGFKSPNIVGINSVTVGWMWTARWMTE